NHLVVLVDQAVAIHVHDPDLAGGLLVLLRFERVLELPDAGELVVVVDLDGGADEPRVARVGLQAARQTHDPIPAPGPRELRGRRTNTSCGAATPASDTARWPCCQSARSSAGASNRRRDWRAG